MTELEKLFSEKLTENGDKAYNTTGKEMIDLLFMADYFENNLAEVHIGNSQKEKLFSMYMRDPRFGQGRKDYGRHLMKLSNVNEDMVVLAGRYDDLWKNPTVNNMNKLYKEVKAGNELAKKWMPRLTGKNKLVAKTIAKMWGLSEKEYRKLIKTDSTVEYKLSYAESAGDESLLQDLFNEKNIIHPLVDSIDFEKVPSLAMTKYLRTFSTRSDLRDRFGEYIIGVKDGKAKLNTTTTNVYDAFKVANKSVGIDAVQDVVSNKIVERETDGIELNCICVLDTSYSMGNFGRGGIIDKATSIAHALSTNSTYAKNQLISFSSFPQLMKIKGNTLKEQYNSMFTGDCSNTDLGKVFKLLMELKEFPEYVIVLSDMELDRGSSNSYKDWLKLVKQHNAKTKLIWWNLNNRNRTTPEHDEHGNIYMSGFDIQALLMLPEVQGADEYMDKILLNYAKNINLL